MNRFIYSAFLLYSSTQSVLYKSISILKACITMVIWGRWTVTMTWMWKHLWRIPVEERGPTFQSSNLENQSGSCTGDTLLRGITVIFPLPPVTSQLFNPYSKRVHWFINSGLKYIFWSGVFQKWLCYLDVSKRHYHNKITTHFPKWQLFLLFSNLPVGIYE